MLFHLSEFEDIAEKLEKGQRTSIEGPHFSKDLFRQIFVLTFDGDELGQYEPSKMLGGRLSDSLELFAIAVQACSA